MEQHIFTGAANRPNLNEFVLDTCLVGSVWQTHSLYEWSPRVVLHCCSSQAARLSFSPIWVCDSSEDSSNLHEKCSQTRGAAFIFGASAHSCWNFNPARKLILWWEVP